MTTQTMVVLAAPALVALLALVWDLRTRRIPNALTAGAFLVALLFHGVTGGLAGLGVSLAGFVTGFGLLLMLWLIGAGGGGDVKLMGALGAWMGATLTLFVFLASAVVALVMMSAVVTARVLGRAAYAGAGEHDERPDDIVGAARRVIPYAVPVAVATWVVLSLSVLYGWS